VESWENKMDDIVNEINDIQISVIRDLEKKLKKFLDKSGLFYKLFSRVKKGQSAKHKIDNRIKNGNATYKLQDIVGLRIALYFKDDIEVCENIIKSNFTVVNISRDEEVIDKFKPTRINYVCRLPDICTDNIGRIWDKYPIDNTFEIQLRTMFSEGWHEIEHDFRYKCKEDWENNSDLSRTLNGVLATLENCDWAMSSLFDDLSYRHYKNKEWLPMMKNRLKIRMQDSEDNETILKVLNENSTLAKAFFRVERYELLRMLSECRVALPLTFGTIIYFINELQIHNEEISKMAPEIIKVFVGEYRDKHSSEKML
jgi:ppGpp synthetase/RelA/SpoT-type nucleotidyltranferase